MSSNNQLVPTTENMVKEGINDMETKLNVLETTITRHRGEIKLTQSTKQTNHKHQKVKYINL